MGHYARRALTTEFPPSPRTLTVTKAEPLDKPNQKYVERAKPEITRDPPRASAGIGIVNGKEA